MLGPVRFDEALHAGFVLYRIAGVDEFSGTVAEHRDHFVLVGVLGGFHESLHGFGRSREGFLVVGVGESGPREQGKKNPQKNLYA